MPRDDCLETFRHFRLIARVRRFGTLRMARSNKDVVFYTRSTKMADFQARGVKTRLDILRRQSIMLRMDADDVLVYGTRQRSWKRVGSAGQRPPSHGLKLWI